MIYNLLTYLDLIIIPFIERLFVVMRIQPVLEGGITENDEDVGSNMVGETLNLGISTLKL